jgi:hypothetical protein
MKQFGIVSIVLLAIWASSSFSSCTYDYLEDFDVEDTLTGPGDTIVDPGDTIILPVDTTVVTYDTSGVPCDPNVVYFESQVLPILISNCGMSGCHDAATAEDNVILTNYFNTFNTADVDPGEPVGSDLYDVLLETGDQMMPPNGPLPADQIALIGQWIQQGGQNLFCNENYGEPIGGGCDTSGITYTQVVKPIIQTYCQGCHSGTYPSNGIDLSTWQGVNAIAIDGSFIGSIDHQTYFSPMPKGGAKLNACYIEKLKAWVAQGAPNN